MEGVNKQGRINKREYRDFNEPRDKGMTPLGRNRNPGLKIGE